VVIDVSQAVDLDHPKAIKHLHTFPGFIIALSSSTHSLTHSNTPTTLPCIFAISQGQLVVIDVSQAVDPGPPQGTRTLTHSHTHTLTLSDTNAMPLLSPHFLLTGPAGGH
jgi:hypothetical protein